MRSILWTRRARADLKAIRAFISEDSPHYAGIVVDQLFAAVERLADFPESGRKVPEIERDDVREVIRRPYRIAYRIVGESEVHILTVHHGARRFPQSL